MNVKQLYKIHLHPSDAADDQDNESSIIDFLAKDSFTAVAAGSNSIGTVWCVKVIDNNCLSDGSCVDGCGNAVGQGVRYLRDHFLEKIDEKEMISSTKFQKNKLSFTKEVLYTKERLCLEQL